MIIPLMGIAILIQNPYRTLKILPSFME